jgi:DNA modification methylase
MANATQQQTDFTNKILHGDCIDAMRQMPAATVDFILTDPPYLVNYRDRLGRSIDNDANSDWLKPAMAEAYRVLKPNRVGSVEPSPSSGNSPMHLRQHYFVIMSLQRME